MSDKNKPTSLNWDQFRALGNPDNVPDEPTEKPNMEKLYAKQSVRILLEKKGRGGKPVSIIKGLKLTKDQMKNLLKELQKICSVGGTMKNHEIIIQGQNRDLILDHLKSVGIKDVKKAGG